MRALPGTVALIGTVFFAVGCSQSTSPTSPAPTPSIARFATLSSLAFLAAAQDQIPFKGKMQGIDIDSDPSPTSIVVTTDGTGLGTYLGRFSFMQRVTVFFGTWHQYRLGSLGRRQWR